MTKSLLELLIAKINFRTPHESLPLQERTFRQFFRLVTSEVSVWYKDHSTPNPLDITPDPAVTKTVIGNKFSAEGVEIVAEPAQFVKHAKRNLKEFKYNMKSLLRKKQ